MNTDPSIDINPADEAEYLRTLIRVWCDAVDAEWNAPYEDLAQAVADRTDAEKYLRAAVHR